MTIEHEVNKIKKCANQRIYYTIFIKIKIKIKKKNYKYNKKFNLSTIVTLDKILFIYKLCMIYI